MNAQAKALLKQMEYTGQRNGTERAVAAPLCRRT
jgi:hypothetical protein